MPFIIPLGHEYIRKRFPRVTIGLIVINTILYFLTFNLQIFQVPGLAIAAERLERYEAEYLARYVREQAGEDDAEGSQREMEFADSDRVLDEFREAMEAGKIVSRGSDEYREWERLYDKFKRKKDRVISRRFGLIPSAPKILSFFTYQFLHADFWHLFWNMYFLWLVGCNIEDVWGRRFFIGVYLAGGAFAGLAHTLLYFSSQMGHQQLVGASGAIAAIMGAFLVRYWSSKIRILVVYWILWVPVWIALIAWFTQQLYYGIKYMYWGSGTAFWSHIGGFAFGALVAYGFERYKLEEKVIGHELEKQDEKDRKRLETRAEAGMTEEEKKPEELVLGIEARKIGRYEEAREHLEKALELYPHDFDVHFELQQVYQRMGLVKEANIHQGVLIGVLLDLDMIDAALERYELLEKADPEVAIPGQGMYRMARLLEERNLYDSAALGYRKFAAEMPDDPMAPKALLKGGSILLEKLKQPKPAAEIFDYILNRYPEAPGREIVEESLKLARKRAG